jgi:hypothetical protein
LTSPPGRREGTSWVVESYNFGIAFFFWIYMDWWWTAKSIEIWYIYILYIYITIYKWLNWAGWLILIPPHFPHSYLLSIVCPSDVQWWDGLKPQFKLVAEAWGTFGQMAWNWVLEHVFHADLSNWGYPIFNSYQFIYFLHKWSQLLIGPPWLFTSCEDSSRAESHRDTLHESKIAMGNPRRSRFEWGNHL